MVSRQAICNVRSRMLGLRDLQRIHRFTWFPERKDAARLECFKLFHFLVVQSEAAQVKIGSHPIRPCGLGQGRPKARGGEDNGGTECIGESETKDLARAETGGEDSYGGQICRSEECAPSALVGKAQQDLRLRLAMLARQLADDRRSVTRACCER